MTLLLLGWGLGLLVVPALARPLGRRLPPSDARSVLAARHQRRTLRVEPGIGWHATVGGHELVVLPSGDPVAFSTAGRPGQVVLSDGLVAALSDPELAAVLRHEVAHVHHRHQRYLLLARTVEQSLGLLPLVAGATGALRCAVERWADEEAAGGDATSRAGVHAALLRLAELAATPEVAAFTTHGTVAERLDALQADPVAGRAVGQRALVYGPAGLLLGAAMVTLGGILAQVSALHALAGLCPPH